MLFARRRWQLLGMPTILLALSCMSVPNPNEPIRRLATEPCTVDRARAHISRRSMTEEDVHTCNAECAADNQGACVALGLLTLEGSLTKRDPRQVTRYFHDACAAGYAPGCTHLAELLERSQFFREDSTRISNIYRAACHAGDALACTHDSVQPLLGASAGPTALFGIQLPPLHASFGVRALAILPQRRASCNAAGPVSSKIGTMNDFIAIVSRVERTMPTGTSTLDTARRIFKTAYDSMAFDYLLPTMETTSPVTVSGSVTSNDIANLCLKPSVTPTGGGELDPLHVIGAIVAHGEPKAPGTGKAPSLSSIEGIWTAVGSYASLKALAAKAAIGPLPASTSQRRIATWVGDVGKAAALWGVSFEDFDGNKTKEAYLKETAAPHDLMADIDGVAMTSSSIASGFAFDSAKSLSENLKSFFDPTPGTRTGRERRFHIFCDVEKFELEQDGVTLKETAKATMRLAIAEFAQWFSKFDPDILMWLAVYAANMSIPLSSREMVVPVVGATVAPLPWLGRDNQSKWFADQFIDFVQANLKSEGK
jgi:TPR repeat protein